MQRNERVHKEVKRPEVSAKESICVQHKKKEDKDKR